MPRFTDSAGHQTLLQLKQKKKSLVDTVNEQLTSSIAGRALNGDRDDYDDYGGVAEEYDLDSNGSGEDLGVDNGTRGSAVRTSSRSAAIGAPSAATDKKVKKTSATTSASRLRRRGPLDPSLSEGKYAATPVNVEAAMDDLFGALDMGDMDAEGEEYLDNDNMMRDADGFDDESMGEDENDSEGEEGLSKKKGKRASKRDEAKPAKRRRAKDLSEEEYTAWLEAKQSKAAMSGKQRRPLSFGATEGGDNAVINSEEAEVLRQLSELRQTQQVHLVPTNEAAMTSSPSSLDAASAASTEAKRTRDVVHHFIMVYGQLLRLRVLLQPAVTKAITMPQYYAQSLFTKADPVIEAAASAADGAHALEELRELQELTAERYASLQAETEEVLRILHDTAMGQQDGAAAEGVGGRYDGYEDGDRPAKKRARGENGPPSYEAIERYHARVLRHADTCLDYWGAKLVQANAAKLKTIAQPLPQQIAAILSVPTRLRSKVQKNRAHLPIMAQPEHFRAVTSPEAAAQRALHIAEGDLDSEIYDDGDFVRELVRRGGAVASPLVQKVLEMQQQLLPSRDGARKGFHRMTKGKAVNYEPRPKLVGFMMAESLEDTERNDVVLKSLFQ